MAVVVVGSINVDFVVRTDRFPKPGETLRGSVFERHPGGKGANQAVAAARARTRVMLAGAVGDDPQGQMMREVLTGSGVDTTLVETVPATTGVALIQIAGGENQIVVVPGANDFIDIDRIGRLPMETGDVCLAQLETRIEVVSHAFRRARAGSAFVVFNPAPADDVARVAFSLVDVVVVNETECAYFARTEPSSDMSEADLKGAARAMGLASTQTLVVTLGAAGVVALADGKRVRLTGYPVAAIDTTGAGDCFCGYLAAGLSRGQTLVDALHVANAAAALAVQVNGAVPSMPRLEAVERFSGRRPYPAVSCDVL